jgi:prepilin-type N-terminal cleavage/methylation domain-containing protein/prepilin-type processing-associated H-X9-DG protein
MGRRSRCAFTLVELLVVIGIVAVLLGVVLAAMSKARESARSVQCLGNLRSLGVAMFSYVQRYQRYPRPASGQVSPEDWFHWTDSPVHKPVNGGIAEFLERGGPASNPVWYCPSDDRDTHTVRSNDRVWYPFSYTVNFVICTFYRLHEQPGGKLSQWPTVTEPDGSRWARTMSYSQVKQPESKILIIDESSETIDDGCWAWQWAAGGGANVLSNRHDRRNEAKTDPNAGYGNASFVDGHAERVPRVRSFDPKYYDPFLPGASPLPPATVPQQTP